MNQSKVSKKKRKEVRKRAKQTNQLIEKINNGEFDPGSG